MMKRLWVVAAWGAALGVWAQPVQTAQASLQSLEEVIAGFIEANGGQKNLNSIISVRAVGKIQPMTGDPVTLTVVRKFPDLKRVSTDHGKYVMHRGFDGVRSWRMAVLADGTRRVEEMTGKEKSDFEADPHHLDLLFFPSGPDLQHAFEGVEYVGRVPCYIVATTMGSFRRVAFLDSRSFRVPRIEEYDLKPEGPVLRAVQELGDYLRVHGIWFARKVVRTLPDGEDVTFQFEQVAVNEGIFDDIFKMPEAE